MQRLTFPKLQPRQGIVVLALIAGLLLAALLARNLFGAREAAIEAAQGRTQELVKLLEVHAQQNLQRVELILASADRVVAERRKEGGSGIQDLQDRLRLLLPKDGLVRTLNVIGSDGAVLVSTLEQDPANLPNLSGRDFLDAQRELARAGMFVGIPVKAVATGLWTLPVSVRVASADAAFQGVLVGELDPGVIERYYAGIDTGANGFVTLFHRSGWIVARAPHSEAIRSRHSAESPMFRQHLPNAPSGTVRQTVAATGIESLYSYGALKDHPLVVSVGLSLTDALAPWRARVWRESVMLLLILGTLAAATLTLLRQLKRREAVEKELRRLSAIVETTSDAVATARVDGQMIYMSAAARRFAGIGMDEDISTRWSQQFYGPERWQVVLQVARPAALRDGAWSGVTRLSVPDGSQFIVSQVLIPQRNEAGEPEFFTGISRDISEIERSRSLLEGQKQVLERVAQGAPLADTLTALMLMIEDQAPGALASVLLLDADGVHLGHGAAPSLPSAYTQAIGGVAIGEGVGSCGTAAFRREAVLVEDIATDPLWKDFSALALSHGLRACWSTPIFAAQGHLLGTFAIYRRQPGLPGAHERTLIDIATQSAAIAISRKQADHALRESEERFRSLTELSSDWYWEQDRELRLTYHSMGFERHSGATSARLLGQLSWEEPGRTPLSGTWDVYRAVLEARQPFHDFEYLRVGADGKTYYVSISGEPVFDADGNFTGYRGVGSNITERKQAEQALLQSERQLRENNLRLESILENLPCGLSLYDRDLHLIKDNALHRKVLDLPDHLFDNLPVSMERIARFNAERGEYGGADIEASVRETLAWARDGKTHTYEPARQNGGYIEISVVPFPDGGLLAMYFDITERKLAEQQRQQLEGQLRQAQKMEALGTLSGGIAHDFNNILAAILGNVALARQDAGANSLVQQSLDEIAKAGTRARDLVQQILAFSRQQPQRRELLDLREIASDAIKLLRASLPANIALHCKVDANCPGVLGDRTQLHQVLMNLGTNAWHAIEAQGGSIDIALEPVQVNGEHTVTAFAPVIPAKAGIQTLVNGIDLPAGLYVQVSVKDNGKGMDAGTLARIFDPFFTTKAPGEGTGLGLSVVDGIVKGHGGAITCYSQVGVGSSFHLYLPAQAQPGQVVTPAQSPSQERSGQGQRILFLDDEEALVRMSTRLIERLGYQVAGFTEGAQALQAFKADPQGFDLLVTDYNMPGPSGLDVAGQMLKIRPDLPVALASGYVTDELREKAAALGIQEVLYKPTAVEGLVEAIDRMLGGPSGFRPTPE